MRYNVIRRNPATGNWVMYRFNHSKKKYVITGWSSSWEFAVKKGV